MNFLDLVFFFEKSGALMRIFRTKWRVDKNSELHSQPNFSSFHLRHGAGSYEIIYSVLLKYLSSNLTKSTMSRNQVCVTTKSEKSMQNLCLFVNQLVIKQFVVVLPRVFSVDELLGVSSLLPLPFFVEVFFLRLRLFFCVFLRW